MTTKLPTPLSVAEFEHLLDVYGADRTRWPLGRRAGAVALLTSDRRARDLLAEAAALDALLAKDSRQDAAAVRNLADRIIAAAGKGGAVVQAEVARPSTWLNLHKLPRSVDNAGRQRAANGARGAALLAASLLVGVFVGQSSFGERAVPALEALSGISIPADAGAAVDLQTDTSDDD